MQIIDIFSLQSHTGEYNTWPLKTQLFMHSKPSKTFLPGYQLLHQFQLPSEEYFLITDWDCPFEESTEFILLSPELKLIANRRLAVPYGSFLLTNLHVIDDDNLKLEFGEGEYWQLIIKPSRNRMLDSFFNRRLLLRSLIIKRLWAC